MRGGFAVIFYLLDQATKFCVLKSIPYGASIPVIPNFFYLVHVRNTGAAFGIFQDSNWFFIILAVIAVFILGLLFYRHVFPTPASRLAAGLLLAGILGNLTDRLVHGSVVDFLDFILPWYGHWPAFNIADSCICIAAAIFICGSFLESRRRV
ncbi:MAG: signal peptidase II [Verrucomicrobia bacterium]|nr:MAG: signal peptidase II [Verrucomicrobiota bacterium]